MVCPKCSNPKKLRKRREDFDYSETSGIPGCILKGVETYSCPKCKNVVRNLGPIEDVTDAVLDILLGQEKLPRVGVQFIRKHYFQETYFQFAKRLRVNPTIIQELEGKTRILSDELAQKIQDAVIKHRAGKVSIGFEF